MILMIDNYDSFTYNIVHYLKELGEEVLVKRNDEITLEEVSTQKPQFIIISPGPSHPGNAGICLKLIQHFQKDIPILGICLGHQCIGVSFGGKIIKAKNIYHGKFSNITHQNTGVFEKLKNPLKVVRYHSLVIDPNSLPSKIEITAKSEDGEIMGIKHTEHPIEGVQFHPESIGSHQGHDLLNNFLKRYRS